MGVVARYAKKMPDAYREEIRAWWELSDWHGYRCQIMRITAA